MVFCSSCGKEIDGNYCSNCGHENKSNAETTSPISSTIVHKKASYLWYALSIVFAIIGGVIAYFVLRKSDPKKARNCLLLGIGMVVLGFIISGVAPDNAYYEAQEDLGYEIGSAIVTNLKEIPESEKELKNEPLEIDKEEQVLSFIKNYKGTDNSGFTLIEAITILLNIMYPDENIISSPATSGYLIASSDYSKEISDRYWKVELGFNMYDGEIVFEWLVDTETNSVYAGNTLGKKVLTLLDARD
jgi:hypothetical protein